MDLTRAGDRLTARPGGSPLNVAVGLARLGADVEFATSFGRDVNGQLLGEHLAASGVNITPSSVGEAMTSIAEATIGVDGSASYRFDLRWDPDVTPARPAVAGHVGSISSVLEPGSRRVIEWAAGLRSRSVISFDPNIRPSITGLGPSLRDAVDRVAALADIIKLSSEDLGFLADEDLPDRWANDGAALVLVTEGERGAMLTTATDRVHVPARAIDVADTIGAGDSFMAGLLFSLGRDGLLDRSALRATHIDELARHAAFAVDCAAITVGREGADPPTLDEVTRSKAR